MLGRRRSMQPEALEALSRLAQSNLVRERVWKEAGSVALYKSTQNEVETGALLDAASHECKAVYLPRVREASKGIMDFALCRGPHELVCGAFDIMEPNPGLCPSCVFTEHSECPDGDDTIVPPPDIFVIPGLAFDRSGQRLGFGGGYYDRFLSNPLLREHSFFIGFAYSFQLVNSLPVEEWDQPVDALCTDAGFEVFRSI